ncbi:MAG: hypothetical protein NC400_00705 [Clostridium sp.]|nr:hypothetical protein [Clostridium sp.]
MRSDIGRKIMLAGSVLFLGLLCLRAKENLLEAEYSAISEEEKEPGVWLETNREGISVKAWYNEEDAKYYFFLPDYLKKENQQKQAVQQAETEQIVLSNIPSIFISLETGTIDTIKESKENKEKMSFSLFMENGGALKKD